MFAKYMGVDKYYAFKKFDPIVSKSDIIYDFICSLKAFGIDQRRIA